MRTDDVLKARLKTTGVVEHKFTLAKNTEFRGVEWVIYDVGGARNQRAAWEPYFDDGERRADVTYLSHSHVLITDPPPDSQRFHFPRADQRVRPAACRGAYT